MISPDLKNDFFSSSNFAYSPTWNVKNLEKIIEAIDKSQFDESRFSVPALTILKDKYCQKNETPVHCLARVAAIFSSNIHHAQRMFNSICQGIIIPSTPMMVSAGTVEGIEEEKDDSSKVDSNKFLSSPEKIEELNNKLKNLKLDSKFNFSLKTSDGMKSPNTRPGLPISCYVNEMQDNYKNSISKLEENMYISKLGGGIGTYMNPVSSKNLLNYLKVMEASTNAFFHPARKSATATYLDASHGSIREFLDIRKPTGGDLRNKTLDLHHGIILSDEFMDAVEKNRDWNLYDNDGQIVDTIKATKIWGSALVTRMETGEPYLFFSGNVNRGTSIIHKKLNLYPKLSNLCTEILLPTGKDYLGKERTAICCILAVNFCHAEKIFQDEFIPFDICLFCDNVLDYFIHYAPKELEDAAYSAFMERSIGIGTLGFHTGLQRKGISIESEEAKEENIKFFSQLNKILKESSKKLADIRGSCPDAIFAEENARFCNITAIAPNATTSIIAGVSPGIEPYISNGYMLKTGIGPYVMKSQELEEILENNNMNNHKTWSSILEKDGSIQHLDLPSGIKNVYKTAFEIDQRALVKLNADRTPFIDQAQSFNIFLHANENKNTLHEIHRDAYKCGVKTFYYCRTKMPRKTEQIIDLENKISCIGCES